MNLIAITGGIGAGKSVVSQVLRAMGYPVYDCDTHAKRIMDNSAELKNQISREISTEAIRADGSIDRPRLSAIVFGDAEKLATLNAIVHGAVKRDLMEWAKAQKGRAFVETAILKESGLDKVVDDVWVVDSPRDVRVARVMLRSGLTREQVEKRMASQSASWPSDASVILNDDSHSLLLQIDALLRAGA
ncbi:MAG: dephospho-CoA kinase [Bacteroidales bacterium]|nr:dephospho-CoA kinase [Bacteroidales bacterium]